MQEKNYNIQPITDQLKAQFPNLALLPNELINRDYNGVYYVLANRDGQVTLSLVAMPDTVGPIITALGQSMGSCMQELVDHVNNGGILLDIDSITTTGPWRFYIRLRTHEDIMWYFERFPNNHMDELTPGSIFDGLGFYLDPVNNLITQYKWYYFDTQTRTEIRQRFDIDGTLINTHASLVDSQISAGFGQSFAAENLDFGNAVLKSHQYSGVDQNYLVITEPSHHGEVSTLGGGGASVNAIPLDVIPEVPPHEVPTDKAFWHRDD